MLFANGEPLVYTSESDNCMKPEQYTIDGAKIWYAKVDKRTQPRQRNKPHKHTQVNATK